MDLGKRIRLLRKEQKRTQQEIATACGFTTSLLSKIENGVTSPPVATLMKIANVLGVRVSDLLEDSSEHNTIFVSANQLSDNEFWVLTNKGYSFFAIAASRKDKLMQPYIFSAKKKDMKPNVFSHQGEEFIYMLEGTMKYKIGAIEYSLNPGDSIYFNSLEEHTLTPISDEVKFLAVFSTE